MTEVKFYDVVDDESKGKLYSHAGIRVVLDIKMQK